MPAAIAVSRRNTTVGSATIRQIKFLSYRTDSGAPFRAQWVFDPGLTAGASGRWLAPSGP
jgi:hypothetical protein